MNSPSPAIVAQNSVRRLPRVALWLFALAYVLPGFWGRAPWKSADMTAFGYMGALARGESPWMAPQLLGLAPTTDALLPYWLGAWVIRLSPSWLPADLAVRTGFAAAYTYPPNVAYTDDFREATDVAQAVGVGLWGECGDPHIPAA